MGQMTVKEGDYLLIGDDIKLYFDRKTDRNTMRIAVDAPRSVPVLRGVLYEKSIAAQAESGNGEALELSNKLKKTRDKTRSNTYASRARRNEQERRITAGEIKPCNP